MVHDLKRNWSLLSVIQVWSEADVSSISVPGRTGLSRRNVSSREER